MKQALRWLGGIAVLAVVCVLALQLYYFVCIGWYRSHDPADTAFMRSRLAALRVADPNARLQQRWVPYARMAPSLKQAVITAEDARFAEHQGVEWEAISKAYENNAKIAAAAPGKRATARIKGGSTITQQLAKNLFLSGERSYVRKGQELVIAYMLEFWLSKQRILEIYLNVVEWGDGVFGAESAAQHYFGVDASHLSSREAAQLAVMLPNPRFYDAHRRTAWLAQRSAVIARWMGDAELP